MTVKEPWNSVRGCAKEREREGERERNREATVGGSGWRARGTHAGGKVRSAWRGMRIRPSGEKVGERGTDEDRERANPGNWNERTLEGRWVVPVLFTIPM